MDADLTLRCVQERVARAVFSRLAPPQAFSPTSPIVSKRKPRAAPPEDTFIGGVDPDSFLTASFNHSRCRGSRFTLLRVLTLA